MKNYMPVVMMIALLTSHSYASQTWYDRTLDYYDEPSDYYVVNKLHQTSALTQADVDRIKLVWFGQAQEAVAAIASLTGTYAAYGAATSVGELLGQNKLLWALMGVAGGGFFAYKNIYPRIQGGILNQVRAYVNLCNTLEIVKYHYKAPAELKLMGTTAGNSAWAGSDIAREKGVIDLLDQGRVALALLDDVEVNKETNDLRKEIGKIRMALMNNLPVVQRAADEALHQRDKRSEADIQRAHRAAELKLTQQQAGFLRAGKFGLLFNTIGNAISGTLKTLVYINDNKEKIAGGLLGIYLLPSIVKGLWRAQFPSK